MLVGDCVAIDNFINDSKNVCRYSYKVGLSTGVDIVFIIDKVSIDKMVGFGYISKKYPDTNINFDKIMEMIKKMIIMCYVR